jgi:predicted nucleic acid-binding protein
VIYVDTNILVDALRGYPPSVAFLEQSAKTNTVGCSQVCEVELLLGAPSRSLRRPVERLLGDLTILKPTQSDFGQAVTLFRRLSLSHGTEFFDCLVAATALRRSLVVHSRNVRHLSAVPGLTVVQPYK